MSTLYNLCKGDRFIFETDKSQRVFTFIGRPTSGENAGRYACLSSAGNEQAFREEVEQIKILSKADTN